ncbi:uncharacterized protein [Watersipora subatra]|uniref:uncharacterized protein n=1 Tax=Watersipora subatra TaxID=2589382 RepID=UPI00355B4205
MSKAMDLSATAFSGLVKIANNFKFRWGLNLKLSLLKFVSVLQLDKHHCSASAFLSALQIPRFVVKMMVQWFNTGFDVPHLWLQNFSSSSWTGLAILCAAVVGVCLVKYLVSTFLFVFNNEKAMRERKLKYSVGMRIMCHALASLGTLLDVAASYLLMLAIMLYNVWMCLVVVLASGFLFFFTSWSHGYIYSHLYSHLHSSGDEMVSSEGSAANAANSQPIDLPADHENEKRRSVETGQLITMSSFQQNQMEEECETSADAATLLVRPDLLAQESEISVRCKGRSNSDPLLDKYPVLRFHNNDLKDTTPIPGRKSTALEFDELDQLIKELSEA